jgi:hypothetical protein
MKLFNKKKQEEKAPEQSLAKDVADHAIGAAVVSMTDGPEHIVEAPASVGVGLTVINTISQLSGNGAIPQKEIDMAIGGIGAGIKAAKRIKKQLKKEKKDEK